MILIVDYYLKEFLEDGMPNGGGSTRQSASWVALLEQSSTDFTIVPDSLRKKSFLSRIKWFRDFAATYPESKFYFSVLGKHTLMCFILRFMLGSRFEYIQRISNNHVMQRRHKQTARFNYFLNKIFISEPDVFLVQNQHQFNTISKLYTGRVTIAENPYTNTKVKLENPAYDFIWIGIIQPQKNIEFLWEIAAGVPEYNFHVIGPNKYGLALKEFDNVIYHGELANSQTLELLSKATCLLNTSLYEGLANIFLEAASRGVPIMKPENIFCPTHCRSYNYDKDNFKHVFCDRVLDTCTSRSQIQLEFYQNQDKINEEVIKYLQ